MPNSTWYGSDSFTYKDNDGMADSNVATVTIAVANVPEGNNIYLQMIRR